MNTTVHVPVMAEEVLLYLNCQIRKIYVDCTVGAGGHTQKILERIIPGGRLIAIDQDKEILKLAKKNLAGYKNIELVCDNFINLDKILHKLKIKKVNGILFDLGVSSLQLDTAERGFSFQKEGPLDMRMNQNNPITARYLVNNLSEKELAQIIYKYGEERWAKRIARYIVKKRVISPINTTTNLAQIIIESVPYQKHRDKIHPATRTFQALRIAVNNELQNLEQSLAKAINFLQTKGRIVVISFHSLEDRIAKNIFRQNSQRCICPPDIPQCVCGQKPLLKIITSKPILASAQEIIINPRARSAKLRVAEKLG